MCVCVFSYIHICTLHIYICIIMTPREHSQPKTRPVGPILLKGRRRQFQSTYVSGNAASASASAPRGIQRPRARPASQVKDPVASRGTQKAGAKSRCTQPKSNSETKGLAETSSACRLYRTAHSKNIHRISGNASPAVDLLQLVVGTSRPCIGAVAATGQRGSTTSSYSTMRKPSRQVPGTPSSLARRVQYLWTLPKVRPLFWWHRFLKGHST